VQPVSTANLGPLVAYLVPGATVLLGASLFSPTLQGWFAAGPADQPTIGGFLYLTVTSLAVGMTVNAVRWATIDQLHVRTGLPIPRLDFSKLGPNVEAINLLNRIHYEHYQFHSNMFVATAIAYVCFRMAPTTILPVGWPDIGFLSVETVFLATSRDTWRRFYSRAAQVLAP